MSLKFWTNNVDCVIAESEEDAKKLVADCYGDNNPEILEGDGGWSILADDKNFSLMEEFDEPPYEKLTTKTCKEWCEQYGRSYLGSTEGF